MNKLHHGETLSLWLDTQDMPSYTKLNEDLYVDVCVIGGGIAGLTTAYLLSQENKKVVLVESAEVGSGQTGKTTAHLSAVLGKRYYELESIHGKEGAQLAAHSHSSAIKVIKNIITKEKIVCDVEEVSGYLFSEDVEILQKELEAVYRTGLDVQLLKRTPLDSLSLLPCLRFPKQLQFHPLKYLKALADKLIQNGGKIFTQTHVQQVDSGHVPKVITESGHSVHCDSLVVATNTPINDIVTIHTKQAAYRSYVIGFKIPKNSISKALYWDTNHPYHYVRLQSHDTYDTLIVGGEDHKTGQEEFPDLCFSNLETWARKKFPVIESVLYKWSGQVMESIDGLGFMGYNPLDRNNVFVITGDSGNGITNGTIGALIVRDQILGRKNPWEKLYDPSRISLRAVGEYLKENANVAAQYSEWLEVKPKPDVNALYRDEGYVFRDGLRMVAAYKNESGHIEFMSAACPHLGGLVRWNKVEKSWDCPCHGSRFDCHGKVLEGPAKQNLKPLDDVELEIPRTAPAAIDYKRMEIL